MRIRYLVQTLAVILACCFSVVSFSRPLDTDALFERYQHLHSNPELSGQETETASYLAGELRAMGYRVTSGVGGTGLVAVLENGAGPRLMYRADMDGLPVTETTGLPYASRAVGVNSAGDKVSVMHACGHDVHMTVLLGVASQMAERRDEWQGTLLLVGQPAEEIGAGARAMLNDGLYSRFPLPDYNLAMHVSASLPAGQVGYVSGYAMANVDSVDITVFGRGGHGAYPHDTKDPVVIAAQIVLALQTIISREVSPIDPAVVTVGSIHGGTKHNVISDEVHMQLTVRSYSDETRSYLLRRIGEISEGIARTAGMDEEHLPRVQLKDEYTPALYNSPVLIEKTVPLLRQALGNNAVVKADPVMGGEDFGRYGRTEENIPGAMFKLGVVSQADHAAAQRGELELPSLHSSLLAPDARPAISTGVEGMTAVLLGLLQQGSTL